MNVLVLSLHGVTWWRVHEGMPAAFRFKHRSGFALLNPLLYPKLTTGDEDAARYVVYGGPADDPESAVICTNLLCLEVPYADFRDADNYYFLFEQAPKLLEQLRFVSKFAKCPTSWQSACVVSIEPSEVRDAFVPAHREAAGVSGFNIDAALTIAKIQAFVELPTDFEPPSYGRLLLDAIMAHATGDYRKSILYAAIAAESMAATKLEEAYNQILSQNHAAPEYRVIEASGPSGVPERRDPVYEELRRGRRSQMKNYLHEMPLYLLGKSLLEDDKALYDAILHIHKQRNDIAHSGGGEIDEAQFSSFSSHQAAVADGIRHVTHLFAWFGESESYPLLNEPVVLG